MTKKDYQVIATALYAVQPKEANQDNQTAWDIAVEQWGACIDSVADVLVADSPRFDRARFLEACETGTTKGMRRVS